MKHGLSTNTKKRIDSSR